MLPKAPFAVHEKLQLVIKIRRKKIATHKMTAVFILKKIAWDTKTKKHPLYLIISVQFIIKIIELTNH